MKELFKPATLGTLTGCIAAEVVAMNTLHHALNWGPRWFALVLAMIIAAGAAVLATRGGDTTAASKLNPIVLTGMVLLNGCLIYTSAFGVQNSVIAQGSGQQALAPPGGEGMTWRTPW